MEKEPFGRPPAYASCSEMQLKIDEYFKTGLKKRTVLIGKQPNQEAIEVEVPTITGLCIYLGFESRQSFYDYEIKPDFTYTIKRARLFIEVEYEEQLQHGNTTGAIFALKNMGWTDKIEQTLQGGDKPVQIEDLTGMTTKELVDRAKAVSKIRQSE
jgi:hypothetical protein